MRHSERILLKRVAFKPLLPIEAENEALNGGENQSPAHTWRIFHKINQGKAVDIYNYHDSLQPFSVDYEVIKKIQNHYCLFIQAKTICLYQNHT